MKSSTGSICNMTACTRPTNTLYNHTGRFCYQHRTGVQYTRLGDLFDVDDKATADLPFEGTVNKDVKIKRFLSADDMSPTIVTVQICTKYMCTQPIRIRLRDIPDVRWSDKLNRILNGEEEEQLVPDEPTRPQKKTSKQKLGAPKAPQKKPPLVALCACLSCTRPINRGYGSSGLVCYKHRGDKCIVPSSTPGSRKKSSPHRIQWDTCGSDTDCHNLTRPFCARDGICVNRREIPNRLPSDDA